MKRQHGCIWVYLFALFTESASKSIDQIIMEVATRDGNAASMLDTFHMEPSGEMSVMVELDIKMDIKQYMKFRSKPSVSRRKRKALKDERTRWKNCYVYYEFQRYHFNKGELAVIRAAMAQWQNYTCLIFKPATSSTPNKIVFQSKTGGCFSRLGMVGGVQEINLAKGCVQKGVVIHEIGHAIGWIHEQARPDRDRYIRVNFNRIPREWHPQFDTFSSDVINMYNVSYDYRSVMHYSGNAVVPNSITTLEPMYQNVIGQRQGLSFRDIHLANLMYECPAMKCPSFKQDCSSSYGRDSFVYMLNGRCQCVCPGGGEDPLKACSQGTPTTTALPETTSTIRPATTLSPGPECMDMMPDCAILVKQGACKMNMEHMDMYCKKSCKFCGKGDMCMDHESFCPWLAKAKFCTDKAFKSVMEKQCQKSCKLCKPVDPCKMQLEMGFDVPPAASAHNSRTVDALLLIVSALVFPTLCSHI